MTSKVYRIFLLDPKILFKDEYNCHLSCLVTFPYDQSMRKNVKHLLKSKFNGIFNYV